MTTDIHKETDLRLTRRTFLGKSVRGIGSLALGSLLTPALLGAAPEIERWQGIVSTPHVPPKAKRIIHLCMAGGPSHLETLDYKPQLAGTARGTDAEVLHGRTADRTTPRTSRLTQMPRSYT